MSRFYIGFFLLLSALTVRAGEVKDSVIFLSVKDTIFLQVGDFDEKLFTHNVREKHTLYSIAKFYGISLETLYFYNPGIANKVLSIDDQLIIPLPNRSILRYKTSQFNEREFIPVIYTVKPGDNLFRIAKVHFKMPVDSVVRRNGLPSHNIHVGQQLLLGWVSIKGIPAKYQQNKSNLQRIRNEQTRQKFDNYTAKRGKRNYEDRGIAYWQKNARAQTKLFALHRTAAINSLISVENPMQRKIVLVRVIGRIPERAYAKEVKVVLSRAAALQLGAKDEKFFVRLKYLR